MSLVGRKRINHKHEKRQNRIYDIWDKSTIKIKLNDPPIQLSYRYIPVNYTTSYTYLGILLNSTLNTSEHLRKALKKSGSRLRLLKRVRYFINADTASTIYKAMVLPLLTYCPMVTTPTMEVHQHSLTILENRAKIIVGKNMLLPNILTIMKKRTCVQVFRILDSDYIENFNNYFQVINTNAVHCGRTIRLPRVRLEVAK